MNGRVVVFALIAFASLWVGSWALSHFEYRDWQHFPSFITMSAGILGGFFGAFLSWKDRP